MAKRRESTNSTRKTLIRNSADVWCPPLLPKSIKILRVWKISSFVRRMAEHWSLTSYLLNLCSAPFVFQSSILLEIAPRASSATGLFVLIGSGISPRGLQFSPLSFIMSIRILEITFFWSDFLLTWFNYLYDFYLWIH